MNNNTFKSILAGLLLATTPLLSQAQGLNMVNYTVQDGLAQSQIRTLNQDADGNLWIGTIGGLSKYNGLGFTNYTEKEGLAETFVSASTKDADGNIWFGHFGGGLTKYDAATKSFVDMKIDKASNYKTVQALFADQSGNIWIGLQNNGVLKLAKGAETATPQFDLKSNVQSIFVDGSGNVWMGTTTGLQVAVGGSVQTFDAGSGFPGDNVTTVLGALEDEVWVAIQGAGVLRIASSGGAVNLNDVQLLDVENGLTSNEINTLYEDHAHRVWISTQGEGLLQFVPSSGDFKAEGLTDGDVNVFATDKELKFQHPLTMLEDREGNIWMGSNIGLNQYMGELFKIYGLQSGLASNLVWTVTAEGQTIWAGTNSGATKITFPQENGQIAYHAPQAETIGGLANNVINAVFTAKDGSVWFAHEANGVSRLMPNGSVKIYGTKEGLPSEKARSIAEDANGNLWIATLAGAAKLNADGSFDVYNSENELGADFVYHLFKDSKGRLWFATMGGALTMFDGSSFTKFDASQTHVEKQLFFHIAEDKEGNIWLVAYNEGLVKYDGSSFSNITVKDGLSNNSPSFVISDGQSNLWLGQASGIEKYDQKSGVFTFYGRESGFLGFETNQTSVARDDHGNIWYGTIKGLVKFAPEKEVINEVEPVTLLDKLQIRLEDADFPEDNVFPYDQNYLTFHLLGISLTSPTQVLYKYQMQGLSEDWTPPTTENIITYSSLPPGSYTLNVMASNNDGVWNDQPTSYSFTIKPPFWQTTWFYILVAVVVIAGVVLYVKIREKNLKARQIELEGIVEERTAELRAEKEIVEKQNHNITESISYAQRIQQAILPPMDTVKSTLPSSFILYRPKDIVSGDFYWVQETDKKVLFAAVDCTGHGVPGAFMSLIGHNLLDRIVAEEGVHEPAKILDRLSTEITRTLRQDADASVKDGMDLALCAIDKSSNKMEFAGAYNPAYVVRGEEVIQLKGDKLSIGSQTGDDVKTFNNQIFDLQKGDRVYVFSDGYADQKGGPKGKKFYYAPFRELLLEMKSKPMAEQRDILDKKITEWKGDIEQYDDMLVFGVEI